MHNVTVGEVSEEVHHGESSKDTFCKFPLGFIR